MLDLSEYKAVLISVGISLLAFFVFFAVLKSFTNMHTVSPADEQRVIRAAFAGQKILLYDKTVRPAGFGEGETSMLVEGLDEPFATKSCLLQANGSGIELDNELLQPGDITVFGDDWYKQVSQIKGFRHTLLGEGYFGVIRVSRPCFNAGYDKAIVYFERDCGPDCGNREVVLLHLTEGKWVRSSQHIVRLTEDD